MAASAFVCSLLCARTARQGRTIRTLADRAVFSPTYALSEKMISPSSPTSGGERCEAFSCIAERSRETAACYFAGSMVKYLYPIPKFYESGETMLNFRPICLEDRAWIEPVMQAAAGHGSEFSFVNLYLWGDQRVASVDGTPVFLSNFSGMSVNDIFLSIFFNSLNVQLPD